MITISDLEKLSTGDVMYLINSRGEESVTFIGFVLDEDDPVIVGKYSDGTMGLFSPLELLATTEDMEKGLYQKYEVRKISNPDKNIDAIVLEFDDPMSQKPIMMWARHMSKNGFKKLHDEVVLKLKSYGYELV